MKQEGLKERMELLEIGEALGWPRLGYGRSTKIPHDKRIPPGKDGWERFAAHAHVRRIYPALRIGRVLRDNNVQVFHPLTAKEAAQVDTQGAGPDVTDQVQGDVQNGASTDVHNSAPPHDEDGPGLAPQPADLLEDFSPPAAPLPRRQRGGHKATRKAGRRPSRSK